eukprot:8672123-Pyramimonas_sp.AAC.1
MPTLLSIASGKSEIARALGTHAGDILRAADDESSISLIQCWPDLRFESVGALKKEPFPLGRGSAFLKCSAACLRRPLLFSIGNRRLTYGRKGASFLL